MSELEAGLKPRQYPAKASLLRRFATRASRFLFSPPSESPISSHREAQTPPYDASSVLSARNDGENEESAAKLWSIYVGEAERYDAALVESWKADMEGMLIFSGLFSASLTAFLIESYKKLQPDSGDLTVAAIQQLAAISLGNVTALQPPAKFTPSAAAVVCNALWFVSLSLSLICALLATLVEQWAREFLHKTEMRPSPARRARIFSFLYFGLKSFHMPTVVDAIPSLIHGSLLLFFAGLVAFLLPINHLIMYLMAGALLVLLIAYSTLTVLPILYLDCPYRTPLSTPLWSLSQRALAFFGKSKTTASTPGIVTMTEAVVDFAIQNTEERDQRAIRWTLDSLTDDTELLPFVEIIPDVISGQHGLRAVDEKHILLPVLGDIQTPSPLVKRILNFTINSQQQVYDENPLFTRRDTAGLAALMSLCMMPRAWEYRFEIPLPGLWKQQIGGTSYCIVQLITDYQKSRWCAHLVETLHDLLQFDHSSPELRSRNEPTIRALLMLVGEQRTFMTSPMTARDTPHPCVDALVDLHDVTVEIGISVTTASQLDRLQQAVDAVHLSYNWAYNCIPQLVFFLRQASFAIQRGVSIFGPHFAHEIIQEIRFNPPKIPIATSPLNFETDPKLDMAVFDWMKPPQPDILAQIAFSLFAFLTVEDQCDSDVFLRHILERGNPNAIEYALAWCDLSALAFAFGTELAEKTELAAFEPHTLRIVHAITVVTGCIFSDVNAVDFMDAVLKHVSPETLSRYPTIPAVHRVRRIGLLDIALQEFCIPDSSLVTPKKLSQLQSLCQDELFSPKLLPLDLSPSANIDDITTLAHDLRKQLIPRHLDFLVEFLTLPIPMSIRRSIRWASFASSPDISWFEVDAEVQHRLFETILLQCRATFVPPRQYNSAEVVFYTHLWSANIFRYRWPSPMQQNPEYNVSGILLDSLRMFLEALEIYKNAADSQEEITEPDHKKLNTTDSERLLAQVRREIAAQESRAGEQSS